MRTARPALKNLNLVVGVAVEPIVLAKIAHEELANFIVRQNEDHERKGREPVDKFDLGSSEGTVDKFVRIAHDCTKRSFEKQTKVEGAVSHTLGLDGEGASLASHQIGPLHNDDRDEEGALCVWQGGLRVEAITLAGQVRLLDVANVVEFGHGASNVGGNALHSFGNTGGTEPSGIFPDWIGCFVEPPVSRLVFLGEPELRRVELVGEFVIDQIVFATLSDFDGAWTLIRTPGGPHRVKTDQDPRGKSVVIEHSEPGVKPSSRLHNTNLQIGEVDQLASDQAIREGIARRFHHDVGFFLFVSERDGGNHVGTQIDAKNEDCGKRKRNSGKNKDQEGRDFWNVGREGVSNRFLEVIKDFAAFFNAIDDGGKVIVEEDHISSTFGNIGTSDTHSNTNIGFTKGR
mmetsp:Transcript_3256/g.4693  ORF Transcript_3256/g.4693 Transcript_3256/m.4693 type:complete len:402 (+) Transcript_3256:260-1465(+)